MSTRTRPNRSRTRALHRTAVLGAAVSLLFTAAACDVGDRTGFQPRPPTTASPVDAPAPGAASGQPAAATAAASTAVPTTEPTASLPGSVTVYGTDHVLTPPGSTLSFGDTATVLTLGDRGLPAVWEVTAYSAVPVTADRVQVTDPGAGAVDHFLCFAGDVTYLGDPSPTVSGPDVLSVTPDGGEASAAPELTPVGADGQPSGVVAGGSDSGCGIPRSTRVPVARSMLVAGERYARGSLAAVTETGSGVPTAVRFDYPTRFGGGAVLWR